MNPKQSDYKGSANAQPPSKRRQATLGIPIAWRSLGQSDHFSVDHEVFHKILRVTRISDAFPHIGALRDAHYWLSTIFKGFDRPKIVLVWDGRRGKLRNDPEFEKAMKEVLPAATEGWREFISVNNTPVMKVQFFRWTREGIACPIVSFSDENEALNYAVAISASGSH